LQNLILAANIQDLNIEVFLDLNRVSNTNDTCAKQVLLILTARVVVVVNVSVIAVTLPMQHCILSLNSVFEITSFLLYTTIEVVLTCS